MAVRCVSPLVLWTLVWASGCSQRTWAEVSTKQIFFRAGIDRVFLLVPFLSRDAQYQWLWTSHDGRHSNISVVTITANILTIPPNMRSVFSLRSWPLSLAIEPIFDIAGVYLLTQTKPAAEEPLARFEVFAVKTILPKSSLDLGSDVSMSCALSHLPEAATLSWYRDEGPTPNTTLLYNNTAHILLHSVDQHSEGTYRCKVEMNGTTLFSAFLLSTNVKRNTYGSQLTLFRESSNSSQVMMICRSSVNYYRRATWIWTRTPNITPVILTSYDTDTDKSTAQVRFSSPAFNGYNFPLLVSPVTFEDGGTYRCGFETYLFVFVQLTTIRVSASPPGGVAWDQPVVLTCELSEGSSVPVTLAWMRVEGSRGVLVQQGVLTESRTLNMTLPSLRRDQLHWECVVFSEGLLRARVPLSLSPSQDQILPPTRPHTASGVQTVIAVACVAVLVAAMLTAALVFYCKRGRDRQISTAPDRGQRRPAEGVEDEDVHYSSISLGGRPAPAGNSASIKDSDVIYSAVNIA